MTHRLETFQCGPPRSSCTSGWINPPVAWMMPPRGTVAILKGAAKIAKDRVAAFLGHRRRFYKDPSTVEAHDCQRGIDHRTHQAQLMRRLKRNPEQFFSRPATPKSLTSLRADKKTIRSGDQVQQELIAHPTSIVSPRLAPIGFAGCKGCCGARHVTRVEVCTVGACAVGLGGRLLHRFSIEARHLRKRSTAEAPEWAAMAESISGCGSTRYPFLIPEVAT